MKLKKRQRAGTGITENKIFIWMLEEIACILLASFGIFALIKGEFVKRGEDHMLCHIVLTVIGIAVVGLSLRQSTLRSELDYDNNEHSGRFWLCFLMGLVVAFACVFLPPAAWPFLPVYVILGLFGNISTGVLGATVLLSIPVCLSNAGIEVLLMYMISGLCGISLFGRLNNVFKVGAPFFMSMGCLLVCETAGTVLLMNARPEPEYFVLPVANLLVSGVLLFGILKLFSDKVVYRYRVNYLDLNNPENDVLMALKEKDRNAYMRNVHTAYFCERIARKLDMNCDLLKCVGYYHNIDEEFMTLLKKRPFPPEALDILDEYHDRSRPVRMRETAVLMASENVINAVLTLIGESNGKKIDYDKVIDAIFDKYEAEGTMLQCDISIRELNAMHRIFKEEKLYYDFLR